MWCSGGGAGGDSLCKGGSCNSCRSAILKVAVGGVVVVVDVVVEVVVGEMVVVVVVVVVRYWWWRSVGGRGVKQHLKG